MQGIRDEKHGRVAAEAKRLCTILQQRRRDIRAVLWHAEDASRDTEPPMNPLSRYNPLVEPSSLQPTKE